MEAKILHQQYRPHLDETYYEVEVVIGARRHVVKCVIAHNGIMHTSLLSKRNKDSMRAMECAGRAISKRVQYAGAIVEMK